MAKKILIKNEQFPRIKNLISYIKKLEAVCPLDKNHLFVVNENKLTVYGHGNGSLGAGFIEASFDVEMDEAFYFTAVLADFLQLCEKTKSDEVTITLDDKARLTFKGNKSKSQFSQVTLSTEASEAKEVSNAVTMFKTSNPYNNAIDLDVSQIKDKLNNASSILNLLGVNQFMKLDDKHITTADNVSVINIPIPKILNDGEEIYIHKGVPGLLNEVNSFKICDWQGTTWVYINVDIQGIELYFAEPSLNFMCPSKQNIIDKSPSDEYVNIKLNSEKLFEAIEEFNGIFDSASWKYGQIKITMVSDGNNGWEPQLQLHYDNMVSCVDTELEYSLIEDTLSNKDSFVIQIPTIHMKFLHDEICSKPEISFKFSNEPSEILSNLKNDEMTIHLVKMDD